ncbi:hypothetical protein AJ66_06181 [Pseudomonas aeruginosa 3579]|nr:hypothetical protein AJ66_06181 [Pseudomonas aeruginosa 3579]EZO00762.1 hypothetical protein AJ65_06174 [Pseudomonas aeruginosa 3578]
MTKANECTCPSGDGSLRHPCPAHPAPVEQAEPASCQGTNCGTTTGDHSSECLAEAAAGQGWELKPGDLCGRDCPIHKILAEQAGGGERVAFEAYRDRRNALLESEGHNPGSKWHVTNAHYPTWEASRAALAQPSPVRSSLLINGYQLRAALDFIAPDGTAEQLESEACIEWRQQDADFLEAGLYAFCAEYPEEGGVLLDEEPTTAQPSPLQSEQAEAERPEMSPERAAYFMRRFKSEEKLLGPNEQAAVDYVLSLLAQHDRIVGALRADRDSWAKRWDEAVRYGARIEEQRDAALARVAELERVLRVVVNAADHGSWPTTVMHGIEKVREVLAGSAPPVKAQPEETPGEILAAKLIETWVTKHGKPAPWSTAVEITALATNMPNDERDRLLALDDDVDAQAQHSVPELLEWAVGRWHAEVSLRPLINVHRRALDDTWRQVIRRLGGDTGLLCGPSHDELLAAAPAQGGE